MSVNTSGPNRLRVPAARPARRQKGVLGEGSKASVPARITVRHARKFLSPTCPAHELRFAT